MAAMWRNATGAVSVSAHQHEEEEAGAALVEEVLRSDLPGQYRVLTARGGDTTAAAEQSPDDTSTLDFREFHKSPVGGKCRDAMCGDELIVSNESCDSVDYLLVAGEDGQLRWEQIPRGRGGVEPAAPSMRSDAPLAHEELLLQQQERWLSAGIEAVCIDGEKEKIKKSSAVGVMGVDAMQCPMSSASLPSLKSGDKSDAEAVTTALRYQSRVTRPKARQAPDARFDGDDDNKSYSENRSVSPVSQVGEKPAVAPAIVPRDSEAPSPRASVSSAPPPQTFAAPPPINITNYAEKGSQYIEHSILDALKTLVLAQQQSMQVLSI